MEKALVRLILFLIMFAAVLIYPLVMLHNLFYIGEPQTDKEFP